MKMKTFVGLSHSTLTRWIFGSDASFSIIQRVRWRVHLHCANYTSSTYLVVLLWEFLEGQMGEGGSESAAFEVLSHTLNCYTQTQLWTSPAPAGSTCDRRQLWSDLMIMWPCPKMNITGRGVFTVIQLLPKQLYPQHMHVWDQRPPPQHPSFFVPHNVW